MFFMFIELRDRQKILLNDVQFVARYSSYQIWFLTFSERKIQEIYIKFNATVQLEFVYDFQF